MANINNLKPFQKGVSGNPAGRPKSARLSDALREQLFKPNKNEKTLADEIAAQLIKLARNGDIQAIKELFDRTEGKPKQSLDVDLNLMDWREMAKANGISEAEVLQDAKRLIEQSVIDSTDA